MKDRRQNSTEASHRGPSDENRRDAMKLGVGGAIGAASVALTGRPGLAQTSDASAFSLDGKVALVTGAARGIGRAIAVACAAAGAEVAALDIADPDAYGDVLGYRLGSQAELDETVALIEALGRRAIGIRTDIADAGAMQEAVQHTLDRLGRLDILIANAGVGGGGRIQDVSDAHFRTVLDINLSGTANTIRAALPHMIRQEEGRIVVITSIAGRMGSGGNADYSASKWGLVGLIKSAAIDLGPHGITVNGIAPTGVRTGIFGDLLDNPDFITGFEAALRYGHTLPVDMLEPADMTGAAVFLASPAAQYITGAVMDVAAGYNARYTG